MAGNDSQKGGADLRLFYALWPEQKTRDELGALIQYLAPNSGRPVPLKNLHITMVFLGTQPAASVPALLGIARAVELDRITLAVDRIGYFRRSRIAWAGMQDTPAALLVAHGQLQQRLLQQGFGFDKHTAFRPHVTLLRDALPPALPQVFAPVMWETGRIELICSEPGPGGVSYRVLK